MTKPTKRWRLTLRDEEGKLYKLARPGDTFLDAMNSITDPKHKGREVVAVKEIKPRGDNHGN